MSTYTTREEISAALDSDGYITGNVTVDLDTLVATSFEDCLDLLSAALVGNELLADISYRPVAVTVDGNIIIAVTGNPAYALETMDGN
jgi:hypothetical protein